MITHVVVMQFKPAVGENDIEELEALLDDLPNRINEIQSYDFGRDVVRSGRSYDFALVSVFANRETLKHYQAHPDHQLVVSKLEAMCDHIVTVDYENRPYPKPVDEGVDPWFGNPLFRRP